MPYDSCLSGQAGVLKTDSETYAVVLLLTLRDFLLRRSRLVGFDLRRMGALCETSCPSAAPSFSRSLVKICASYCAARDGNVGHAVVEQVFRSQLGIDVDQHAVGGLPLAGMARHRIAMIEMRMLRGSSSISRPPSIFILIRPSWPMSLDGPQLAVRHLQFVRGRGELHAVAHGERPLLLAIDGDTLLAAWIIALLRAVRPLDGEPVAWSIDALHAGILAFADAGLLRAAA